MPDGLDERDALAWAERQARLLSRLAAGERLNEAIDWPNVIDEVRDVGLSELRSCRSLLRQALVHLLKLAAWPDNRAAPHRRAETAASLADARDRFAPSMRQRMELDELYDAALHQVRTETADAPPLPQACAFALDDLLAKRPDVAALARALQAGGP